MTNMFNNLRIFPGRELKSYVMKRYNRKWISDLNLDNMFNAEWFLVHAWKPGLVELNDLQVSMVQGIIRGQEGDINKLPQLPEEWINSEEHITIDEIINKVLPPNLFSLLPILLRSNKDTSLQIEKLMKKISKILPIFPAIQNEYELKQFLSIVSKLTPRTIVEIGTAGGGVLYSLTQLAHPSAKIISIDYDGGPYGGGQNDDEIKVLRAFCSTMQTMHFIRDRSFHHSTKIELKKILGVDEINLLFIDGDHSYGGVSSDYYMYRDLVASDGVIVFHDINTVPSIWGRGYDVGIFWDEIKPRYGKSLELLDPRGVSNPEKRYGNIIPLSYGIGVLYNTTYKS